MRSEGQSSRGERIARFVIVILVPPVAMLAAIHSQPLGAVIARRPGLLAIALLTLALALSFRRLRRLLMVVLAYSAALVAVRGLYRAWFVGPPVALGSIGKLYGVGWVALLVLAAYAGTLEILRPGTVLAKRLMFAAAAIFLLGHGTVGLMEVPNVLSWSAIGAGVSSLIAAVLAHRIARLGQEVPLPDIPTAGALAAERRRKLAAREWRDSGRGR